jgi:cyclopropane-fatty-acyl-phospholipid synthase
MQSVLDLFSRRFRNGTLEFVAPGGRRWTLGRGEPHARIRLRNASTFWRIAIDPALALGETYMDGAWEPEAGRLLPVLEVCARNVAQSSGPSLLRRWRIWRSRLHEWNGPWRARRNASHHYDLDADLYRRFLDADLHYSCAYFRTPDATLEAAQQAKCAHIAAKLDLRPGARVLDIGCGWGSMAMYLAQRFDVQVVGITLSEEQVRLARERAARRGLQDSVEFRLQDYREVRGRFDAIVSIGMFEHVGRPQYPAFFRQMHELLEGDGVALLHFIGRRSMPGATNRWVRKNIFPGGYVPAASEVLPAIEASRLIMTDLEVWRLHYARTLAAWHERFQRERAAIASRMGERFCRMWEFYLQASEAAFRWDDLVVFQVQMTQQLRRLPLTRDYLYREPAVRAGSLPQDAAAGVRSPARSARGTRSRSQ